MLHPEKHEDEEFLPLKNREVAGRLLARKLSSFAGQKNVVVVGLVRGGMAVAFELASSLHLPLDFLVVRKLGTPWNKELAIGAVAPHGIRVMDLSLAEDLGLSEETIQELAKIEEDELHRRERLYRKGRPPLKVLGKTVILVDDGAATGYSVLAAVAALRREQAARIIVALPLASASAGNAIRMEADQFISLAEPGRLVAISGWYQDFKQVSDDEVLTLLEQNDERLARVA